MITSLSRTLLVAATLFLTGTSSSSDIDRQDLTDPNFFIQSRYNISTDNTELTPPEREVSEETAVVADKLIWTENNISTYKVDGVLKIPICWLDLSDKYKEGREITAKAIKNSWERFIKVEFVGWEKLCNKDSWSIKIKVEDSNPHTLGLGNQLEVKKGYSMLLNFDLDMWMRGACNGVYDRKTCIHSIAVHEFGHVLGMEHEHNNLFHQISTSGLTEPVRLKMIQNCRVKEGTSSGDITWSELAASWRTKYDKNSVMNYCKNIYNHTVSPSQLDINSLRKFYKARLVSADAYNG